MSLPTPTPDPVNASNATSSCVTCRRRKIRCNRNVPCSNCVRSGCQCDYPGSGRKPSQRPNKNGPQYDRTAQARLLDKVRRLEEMVEDLSGKVESNNQESAVDSQSPSGLAGGQENSPVNSFGNSVGESHTSSVPRNGPGIASSIYPKLSKRFGNREEPGLLVSSNRGKLYVSGDFWITLRQEIRQVRESFEQEDEGDTDVESAYSANSPFTHTKSAYASFIFPNSNISDGFTDDMFPLPSQMLFIWRTYVENIDPMVKVLHVPTVSHVLENCRGQLRTLDPTMLCLFACISFAAIQSMSNEEVMLNFGTDKKSLSSRYRRGAEKAIANADVINTTNLAAVQALIIYLGVLPSEESTRYVWTLVGMLNRIAFTLGLHRDGTSFKNISPFDVEMRRRIWWNLCFLDSRIGETQVHVALIHEHMFTTERPSNINDSDIHPGMTEPVIPRHGPTDMSIHLARSEIWRFARVLELVTPSSGMTEESDHSKVYERKLEAVRDFKKRMTEEYAILDCSSGAASYVSLTINLLADRIELIAHYQYSLAEKQGPSFPREAFQVALSILDRYRLVENDPAMSKWSWALKGYVKWQELGVILSYLCASPWDEESERAWQSVDSYLNSTADVIKQEPFWQPFQRLFLRASQFRNDFLHVHENSIGSNESNRRIDTESIRDTGHRQSSSYMPAGSGSDSTVHTSTQRDTDVNTSPSQLALPGSSWHTICEEQADPNSQHTYAQPQHPGGIENGSSLDFMDLTDWPNWNECLQQGFFGLGGI
ncbi:hypothetical protein M426DRAFT_70591 [Hypoxylon sp. CI-4A]|nr:hypothetical protein M426DRAFT_70591 [Hypoxylon sp. CI-4A]